MTTIEWTDETWNPLRARRKDGGGRLGWACVRVSQGCVNCYAATQNRSAGPMGGTGLDYTVPNIQKVEIVMLPAHLEKPLHWRSPRRIFVCSMTDLFGEFVSDAQIDGVFGLMELTAMTRHTFQVLTKRPERMRAYLTRRWGPKPDDERYMHGERVYRPRHIWLGTSVENQEAADARIPELLETPAAVRFLSCEPLLGPVKIGIYLPMRPSRVFDDPARERELNTGWKSGNGVDWVIAGGESGDEARPFDLTWARSLRDQCAAARVPFFLKQLGAKRVVDGSAATALFDLGSLRESRGRDISEWPEDLRVREFPR